MIFGLQFIQSRCAIRGHVMKKTDRLFDFVESQASAIRAVLTPLPSFSDRARTPKLTCTLYLYSHARRIQLLLKNLLTMPVAMLPAKPPEYIAFPASPDAWLNLSQRENARVLVIVSTRAITADSLACHPTISFASAVSRTNQDQPNELHLQHCHQPQCNPEQRLDIHRQPKEATVRSIDNLDGWIGRLKDPLRGTGLGVYFVPPAKSDEAAAGNVLEVIKVRGEEEDGDDEAEDEVFEDRKSVV